MKLRLVLYGAVIASVYTAISVICAPISYGLVQVRIAEALTVLPAISPVGIWGVFVGCLVANLILGNVLDVIFGSLTTLLAGFLSYKLKKNKWLVPLPPVLLNGLVVGGYLTQVYGGLWYMNMLTVAIGQIVSCYVLGIPLLVLILRNKQMHKFFENSWHDKTFIV